MIDRPAICRAPEGLAAETGPQDDRFAGIVRDYTPADAEKLSGSFRVRHTLA